MPYDLLKIVLCISLFMLKSLLQNGKPNLADLQKSPFFGINLEDQILPLFELNKQIQGKCLTDKN